MTKNHLNPKFHGRNRSNSLPSKSHLLVLQCNEYLCRLCASEANTYSSVLERKKLCGLQDLHEFMEKLFQLSLTQEAIFEERKETWVDELLDGSLRLLDMCTAARDALLHTKECTREMALANEVKKYLDSRKVVRKAIRKALGNLKSPESRCFFSAVNKDHQTVALIGLLRGVQVVSLSIFESLLSTQSKSSGWSLISKLMLNKRVACSQEADENEFSKVDAALQSFDRFGNSKVHLLCSVSWKSWSLCIQDLEEGLGSLFRRLIKTRLALLNILNHSLIS